MEVSFWGVRGCIAAPGAEFNRYGGNTACVSIRSTKGELLILDAGTGIVLLGRALMATEFGRGGGEATMFLTHAHWDHIQGFPFFVPLHVAGNRFVIHGPSASPSMLEGILEGQMSPHFSPVQTLRNLKAEIALRTTGEGAPFEKGGVRVDSLAVPHGRITSLAYRVEVDGRTVVYVPDAGYDEPGDEVIDFYRGADYLIHDCTYTPEDRSDRRPRGYASIAIASHVAAAAQVKRLVMFHYDQDYTDEQVDRLACDCRTLLDAQPGGDGVELIAASEGMVLSD